MKKPEYFPPHTHSSNVSRNLFSPLLFFSRSSIALLRPFDVSLWACTPCVLLLFSLVLFLVARVESKLSAETHYWCALAASFWYAYATLLSESITRHHHVKRAWAVRVCIAGWLLFGVVMATSYGGNLRAHVLRPDLSAPIDSLGKILDSGLPWNMVLYGTALDKVIFARMEDDPVLRRFIGGRMDAEYDSFPFRRVSEVY